MKTAMMFKAPAERLTLNGRLHWTERAELVRVWRTAAGIHARNAGIRDLKPSTVQVTFFVTQRRRRDPHNAIATVKAIIDGLVDAKVWPDDNSDWVTVLDPVFEVVDHSWTVADFVSVDIIEKEEQ